jgi:hypothetical protein
METDGPYPMDDMLAMSRTCGIVLAAREARRAYRRLRRKIELASRNWDWATEPQRAAMVEAYERAFRDKFRLTKRTGNDDTSSL